MLSRKVSEAVKQQQHQKLIASIVAAHRPRYYAIKADDLPKTARDLADEDATFGPDVNKKDPLNEADQFIAPSENSGDFALPYNKNKPRKKDSVEYTKNEATEPISYEKQRK